MTRELPKPVVHSFIPCREIFQDNRSGEYILIALMDHKVAAASFPATMPLSLYAYLSAVRGTVVPELQLRDESGAPAKDESGNTWRHSFPGPLPNEDPLQPCRVRLSGLRIPMPRPGRFDLLLLVDGNEIARYPFVFVGPEPTEGRGTWE
jgi:hypothetical protein